MSPPSVFLSAAQRYNFRMALSQKRLFLSCCAFALLVTALPAQQDRDVAARLAKWKSVDMPFHSAGLTDRERQMVDKLVEACRLLDDVYWRQSDLAGLALYKSTHNPDLKTLLTIMGGRWDLIDENRPFAGAPPMPPGHDLYPHDLTRAAAEQYVKQHPESKAALYDPYTVVKRQASGALAATPYTTEYKAQLVPMAQALREAAAFSPDPQFANFLRLRADALLSSDYYKSDLAWLELKNPKFDVIFAPYETYLDDLLGIKTSFGASLLIRNDAESQRLSVYQKYVPDIEDALPVDAYARPSKRGHLTPMEVMDAPYRAGDLRHGYQAVADNLPNDPRIHQEKGTKKIFFNNFLFWRTQAVILPLSNRVMDINQTAKVTPEGFMASVVMHEISHELGPDFATVNGKRIDIREAIGPPYSGLEEAKADVVGMFGLKWLVDHHALQKSDMQEYYASYVASMFRTLRFGTGEAHGRAEMMEFNYLLENHALNFADGRYSVDYSLMPSALAQLAKILLETEATGDRTRAENWFRKYDVMPADLKKALAGTTDIPIDINPVFSFKDDAQ
jgi:hypothetical protein